MKRSTEILDKISGYFFLAGFVSSKLRYIPIFFLSQLLTITSLATYLIGYSAWYFAALTYPNYPRKHQAWYGFSEFKEQYQLASLLGTLATIICIVSGALSWVVLALWLYTLSNLIWSISEYHKRENPAPYEPGFSAERQTIYIKYALIVTVISALAAIAGTIAITVPIIAAFSLTFSTIVGNALTILALYYWKQSLSQPTPTNSYTKLNHVLTTFSPPHTNHTSITSITRQPQTIYYEPTIPAKSPQGLPVDTNEGIVPTLNSTLSYR